MCYLCGTNILSPEFGIDAASLTDQTSGFTAQEIEAQSNNSASNDALSDILHIDERYAVTGTNFGYWNELSVNEQKSVLLNNYYHLDSGYYQTTATVTYSFLTSADGRASLSKVPSGEVFQFEAFDNTEQEFTREYLEYLSGILNIDFVETSNNSGTLGFGKHNMTAGGYADYPFYGRDQGVWLSSSSTSDAIGDFGFGTIVHELGHALGLSHPNDYDNPFATTKLSANLDTTMLTKMSYFPTYTTNGSDKGYLYGFGALDYYTLINRYGANSTTEDNTYIFGGSSSFEKAGTTINIPATVPFTLADNGGTDIIDASQFTNVSGVSNIIFNFDRGLFLNGTQTVQVYDRDTKEWVTLSNPTDAPYLEIYHFHEIEQYIGTSLIDVVTGNASQQTITGGGANDVIDGGDGIDTAKYTGEAKNFTIQIVKNGATTVQDRNGSEGTDSLTNIEQIDFTGTKDVDLSILAGVANVSSADLSTFIEMYIAYFNRAPDAEGLFYWGTRLSEGMSIQDIAASFFVQTETVALYGGKSNSELVDAVYQNFLGRAPDTEGKTYWVSELDNGIVQRGEFLLAIINGAKASTGSAADQAYIEAKADIGTYYSVIKGMSDVDNAKAAMALYDGSASSKTFAKSTIDSYYTSASAASNGELVIQLVGVMDDPFA